jgi:putative transposase
MVERADTRITRTSGMNTWRAGCGESRTSGSEGGPGKPTSRKADRAPRSDPYTKLRGPGRGIWFQLYVVLDIFSRYVLAWTVQATEDSEIAKTMMEEAMGVHGIPEAIHADRGTSMTSKPVAQLLLDLGVDRSHSRPRVSNDNPFSEAAFKTLKYAPVFPEAFGSLADARAFCATFFGYYNHEHRHSEIGLHTPASVHHGTAPEIRAQRQHTLDAAHAAHPERFGNRRPQAPKLPKAAWINQPSPQALIQTA